MTFPQLDLSDNKLIAHIQTNKGEISIALFPDKAPKTVENFMGLAKPGKYDGVIFHRVIKDFMIQGGDPTGTGYGGESFFGHPFADEFSTDLFNFNGALSMANSGPNSNGSQFFIVTAKDVPDMLIEQMQMLQWPEEVIATYRDNGGAPWLDQKHTVFGQVIDGMETVYAIEEVSTDDNDKPIDDIVIENIHFSDDTKDVNSVE